MVNIFIRKHPIKVDECSAETIKSWVHNAKEVMIKSEGLGKNDIRRCFECWMLWRMCKTCFALACRDVELGSNKTCTAHENKLNFYF